MESIICSPTCSAANLSADARNAIALFILNAETTITSISKQYDVSRKFLHGIKNKAIAAVKQAFHEKENNQNKVLFTIDITKQWIEQFVLSVQLHGKSSYRGVQSILSDMFDYKLSLGAINKIGASAKARAKEINQSQTLENVVLGAHDEMFHNNKPILTGVDIRSLYCYLLSQEDHRDEDTWGIHLMDLQEQGLKPERVFADQADGLRSGHAVAMPEVPCDGDHFHIIMKMMKMRIFFRNRMKSAKTYLGKLEERIRKAQKKGKQTKATDLYDESKSHYQQMLFLYKNIDTLVNWMRLDVLKMEGPCPSVRSDLYDFIVGELKKLAAIHQHRISDVCTSLENQKNDLLAFSEVLNEKFIKIAEHFNCPLSIIWDICVMQKYKNGSDKYLDIKEFQNKK